jgi:hypothetical protein
MLLLLWYLPLILFSGACDAVETRSEPAPGGSIDIESHSSQEQTALAIGTSRIITRKSDLRLR